ncbi:MAG TPA: sterol desaturase family protein [Cyclobacteriaceae bacterium]
MSEIFWNGNSINPAAFIIPAFFLFIGLEYAAAKRLGKSSLFKFDSSIANISIGLAERLINLFITASFYSMFVYVYEHYAVFKISDSWIVWILILLATDLVWYWYHRLGHEINIFWAAHIVHHQSEEFNYTVSARITVFQALIRNVFWCLLPLAGFNPTMVFATLIIHGAYSFFTHTQMIGKLGWLEYIFITPSHHGVHHASNEKYLNKNYGDLFVFWDKLFGTFQKEEEKPVYGLTHPLKSNSFIWQHFHYFLEILEAVKRTTGFRGKLKVIFGPPETLDQSIRPDLEKFYLSQKRRIKPTSRFKWYVTGQIVLTVFILFGVSFFFFSLDQAEKIFATLFILITLINCGALLEQVRWIFYLEYARMLIVVAYISVLVSAPEFFIVGLLTLIVIGGLFPVQRWYLRFIYSR